MYRIQDKYRIKYQDSTDELICHLSRTSNSQAHWSTDELTGHFSRTSYWEIAINIWQQCKSSPKFANSPQYPIPNPQYREQHLSAAKFLIEDKSLSPPLKTVTASSGVS
ncbi:hypothetical protein H6G54_22375 [Anabaena cylindrica FACHB-243]|uniref:Uncharacterized protein n=1 Tax=Anabaena cylindrica (strain ATCC 27899 / PCC 7122) TaxID=272123 RepID=K9ZS90_ANACC|nr:MULTISPECIES: hypothetical protein [Anabaena]AFZ61402.1 hypothetical protein Anacy_6132 [Anabaena cylindrica PCC 7122]MBD2420399.1 hypothetical protein [Anabaena cylindrica FACHB-243]MBY5281890.1 hypothetical protein [Anabaena sp. CCAP 1446/1C]MBY5306961.1 hypothetical protein [Anabaena sp. CCAP 1446/1C]MCM2405978.1 hypothetical protein [Anabaena sp. CCAP 1446/1C]